MFIKMLIVSIIMVAIVMLALGLFMDRWLASPSSQGSVGFADLTGLGWLRRADGSSWLAVRRVNC